MRSSGNEMSSVSGPQSGDELSLLDLMAFFRHHYLALLGGAFIGGALGLVIAFVVPMQWEASVLLKVGQIGNAGNVGTLIEPAVRVVERVKNRSFENDVLRRMGVSPNEAGLLRDGLKVGMEKSELLSLHVRGVSQKAAEQLVSATMAELKEVHAKMAEPTLDRWRKELDEINLELGQVGSESDRLSHLVGGQSSSVSDRTFYLSVLASNILLSRETELRKLRERKRLLQEQLSPERTFPTAAWGGVEVSGQPVFPKKSIFAAVGLIIGLLIGVLLSVLRHTGARRNTQIRTD